jgi:hypothetical protein
MKRPLAVTIISWIYIVMGTVGFIYHFRELRIDGLHLEAVLVEGLRILAVVAGYFMLMGKNFARWIAILWIGLHVGISFYHDWQQVMMHAIFFVIITYFLTRPAANAFFKSDAKA